MASSKSQVPLTWSSFTAVSHLYTQEMMLRIGIIHKSCLFRLTIPSMMTWPQTIHCTSCFHDSRLEPSSKHSSKSTCRRSIHCALLFTARASPMNWTDTGMESSPFHMTGWLFFSQYLLWAVKLTLRRLSLQELQSTPPTPQNYSVQPQFI